MSIISLIVKKWRWIVWSLINILKGGYHENRENWIVIKWLLLNNNHRLCLMRKLWNLANLWNLWNWRLLLFFYWSIFQGYLLWRYLYWYRVLFIYPLFFSPSLRYKKTLLFSFKASIDHPSCWKFNTTASSCISKSKTFFCDQHQKPIFFLRYKIFNFPAI